MRLFNQGGIHATGVDKVQAVSGVSKTTLYKYFTSKEALVEAALEQHHVEFMQWLDTSVERISASRYAGDPQGPIIAVFDALDEWFQQPDFNGCHFINASAEFANDSQAVSALIISHKYAILAKVEALLTPLAITEKKRLAQQICVLYDGAIVQAHALGNKHVILTIKLMLRDLLDRAVTQH